MARITIEDCLKHIPNRFQMTLVATNRARQITMGGTAQIASERDKATVVALREISLGLVGLEILNRGQA